MHSSQQYKKERKQVHGRLTYPPPPSPRGRSSVYHPPSGSMYKPCTLPRNLQTKGCGAVGRLSTVPPSRSSLSAPKRAGCHPPFGGESHIFAVRRGGRGRDEIHVGTRAGSAAVCRERRQCCRGMHLHRPMFLLFCIFVAFLPRKLRWVPTR